MTPIALIAVGAAAVAVAWWLGSPTETVDGVVRFKDSRREKIFDALNSTVPVPVVQPAFANASTFQVTRFEPSSASTMFLVESARAAGFPVAISDNILEVIAAPNDMPAYLVTMQRGEESKIAAPGRGFALIVE